MVSQLAEKYDYIMNDLADPRVKNWTGSDLSFVLTVEAIYFLSVYVILPAYMKNRKPYELKTLLFYYNIFQIVSCCMLIYGVSTSGWTTTYSLGCQPVDYSENPEALRMLRWCYFTYVLKGIELIETSFFVLRKKFNQVTPLHVYHHSSTFMLTWLGLKYIGGGMATFPIIINSIIHVFMYTYYLFASFGKDWQRSLQKWKPRLTIFQMVQFCIIIAHALQSLHPECNVPKQLLLIYVPNILLVFYMFYRFYQDNYVRKGGKVHRK